MLFVGCQCVKISCNYITKEIKSVGVHARPIDQAEGGGLAGRVGLTLWRMRWLYGTLSVYLLHFFLFLHRMSVYCILFQILFCPSTTMWMAVMWSKRGRNQEAQREKRTIPMKKITCSYGDSPSTSSHSYWVSASFLILLCWDEVYIGLLRH